MMWCNTTGQASSAGQCAGCKHAPLVPPCMHAHTPSTALMQACKLRMDAQQRIGMHAPRRRCSGPAPLLSGRPAGADGMHSAYPLDCWCCRCYCCWVLLVLLAAAASRWCASQGPRATSLATSLRGCWHQGTPYTALAGNNKVYHLPNTLIAKVEGIYT